MLFWVVVIHAVILHHVKERSDLLKSVKVLCALFSVIGSTFHWITDVKIRVNGRKPVSGHDCGWKRNMKDCVPPLKVCHFGKISDCHIKQQAQILLKFSRCYLLYFFAAFLFVFSQEF